MWMLVVLLVSYNLYVERYYILSLRLFRITLKKAAIAAAIGLGLSMLVPLFYLGLGMLFPEAVDDTLGTVSSLSPFLVLAGVITAAVCEEVLFRAYPLERLEGSFNKKWPGVIISLLAFVVVHAESWSALHIFGIVMPMGVVLTYLYLKTRRLTFVILVHFFFDLPLFIMTLIE